MTQKPIIFLAFANDKTEDGVYLRNLSKEMHGIREVLNEAVKNGLCEIIERSSATIADIVDVFQNPSYQSRIAVFHYAGHAGSEGLLLETLEGSHSMAHKDGLVDILARQRGLKLVFLNGCSSEEQTNALLASGVSGVIGTTASINDDVATQLSIRFYKGLGMGNGIEKTWNDCVSELKIAIGSDITRAVKSLAKKEKVSAFPWVIKFREGSEIVKKWNLPDAAGNALFGLPEPLAIGVPESPFVYLNNFEKSHAEVFFGRSKYIRDLYFHVIDEHAPHLILLFGQSGVGKTSLLKAGLSPRLESSYEVVFLKRDDELGLETTLFKALLAKCGFTDEHFQEIGKTGSKDNAIISSLESIANSIDKEIQPELIKIINRIREKYTAGTAPGSNQQTPPASLYDLWNLTEELLKKPVFVIYDQIEEAYTRPAIHNPNEVSTFLASLNKVFNGSANQPKGKILLCYRKEYQSEIEEQCSAIEISRSRVFLDHFKKPDILSIFSGLTEHPRIKSRYNLSIDEELPALIASDYTRASNESPVGPVFQILLTKMWLRAQEKNPGSPYFSLELYKELREEGVAMEEFLATQLEMLKTKVPEAYESGLALDLLAFHITKNNTAGVKTEKEIFKKYPNSHDVIRKTLDVCIELFLLLEASSGTKATQLTHDLLAVGVDKYYQASMKPVQQANRILNSRMESIRSGSKDTILDDYDLSVIEMASPFMRNLSKDEIKLIEEGKKVSEKKKRQKKKFRIVRQIIVGSAIAVSLVIGALYLKLKVQEKQTLMNQKAAEASLALKRDVSHSLYLAVEGLEISGIDEGSNRLKEALISAFYTGLRDNAARYKILVKSDNAIINILYSNDIENPMIIPLPQDSVAKVYNYDGEVLATLKSVDNDKGTSSFSLLRMAEFGFDKKTIIGLGTDSILRIWDVKGKNIYESSHGSKIRAFCASPISNVIAYDIGDSIKFISTKGELIQAIKLVGAAKSIGYSPDGSKLLITPNVGPAQIFSIKERQSIWLDNEIDHFNSAVFSNNGKRVLSCQNDSIMVLWSINGEEIHRFAPAKEKITYYEFHPTDSIFLVCSGKSVKFYSATQFKEHVMMGIKGSDFITKSVFSKSGIKVLTCSSDKLAGIRDTLLPKNNGFTLLTSAAEHTNLPGWNANSRFKMLSGHHLDVTCGFFTVDEQTVFTGSLDGTLRAWRLELSRPWGFPGHRGSVNYVKLHPNGKFLFSIGQDNTILVRSAMDASNAQKSKLVYGKSLRDPDYSIDGSNILCLSDSNEVISWKWSADNPPIRLSKAPGNIAKAIYFGDDSVATVSDDGRLRLFSGSGKLYKTLRICDTALTYVQYSYKEKKLAIATTSGLLYIIDPYTNKMKTLVGHKKNLAVTACTFSNDGLHLVSISEDNTAIIWDLRKNTHRVLDRAIFAPYYQMKINSARFSPDGKQIVIAYSDRTARVWNTNGNLMATLMGHTGNVFDAAFTENGKKIYTVSDDKTVRWWDSNGDYINWFNFGGGHPINQIAVNATADYIYAGMPNGLIQVRITAGGIYDTIVKSEYYNFFKEHRERYSDIDSQN